MLLLSGITQHITTTQSSVASIASAAEANPQGHRHYPSIQPQVESTASALKVSPRVTHRDRHTHKR